MRLVYVSPLKALSYDVERNLRAPLAGIGADLSVALRTGDTPQRERQAMLRRPPDILITTPESLYLMLTSQARDILTDVEAAIVDEIHAVAPTKRAAHMALTLERLERHIAVNADDGTGRERRLQRIGLSATQRPLERIASFLVGPGRECEIVDAGVAKELDLEIVVPVEDMADPGSTSPAGSSASRPGAADGGADGSRSTARPGAAAEEADGGAADIELPSTIVLEITERASIEKMGDITNIVKNLRLLGYRLAVDDLGTGYAGLSSFTQLSPEIVKLDRSLVEGVDSNATKQRVVRAMLQLCADLKMQVISEGVETEAERSALASLGADLLQGYLFGRPASHFNDPTV